MKTFRSKQAGKNGSVLIVALGMTALFALILGSYLTLVAAQAASVARSQSYNIAIPVAEAGVEEALALLNKNGGASTWTNTLTADGWSEMTSSNTTTKSNLVFGNNYYQVTISNPPAGQPTIVSAGVVPFNHYAWGNLLDTNCTSISSSTVALVRTVRIQTTNTTSLFGNALAARQGILFSAGANVDSFNSAVPTLSSNGQYNVNSSGDQAIVASAAQGTSAISGSGGVTIRGYLNTGAGSTISTGSCSVGDNSWVNTLTPGIESGHSNDNFNMTFPDVSTPSATFVETPSSGNVGGTNYTMVLRGNQYWGSSNVMYQTSLQLSGGQMAIVTNGAVKVYIPPSGSMNFSGSSYVYVAPGTSLTVYCGAQQATISGSSFVGATNSGQLAIYGLPTCTKFTFSGGNFVGTIYAPEAAFIESGSAIIIGAIVADSLDFTGSATVHYDQNLAGSTFGGYAANYWQEIATPPAYQALAP